MPGSGHRAGGIDSWDHDNDPLTPPKTLVPGIDSLFGPPDTNSVFDHRTFVPESIDPDDITSIRTLQLNPCDSATCTADEIAAGKDNLPDVVIMTRTDEPSYTILSDPTNPSTLQPPIAIGSDEHDDRDVEVVDVNGDGVPDLIMASHDAPNRVYYGDPTRPGDWSSTKHDEFGSVGDGTIGIEVVDLDNDPATPPDIVVANEKAIDQLYLGLYSDAQSTGAGTGLFDRRYTEKSIPTTLPAAGTTTDVSVEKGLGSDADSFIAVFTNSDFLTQVIELSPTKKAGILDLTSPWFKRVFKEKKPKAPPAAPKGVRPYTLRTEGSNSRAKLTASL